MIKRYRWLLIVFTVSASFLVGSLAWHCWYNPCFKSGHTLTLSDGQSVQVGLLTDNKQRYRGFSRQEQPCPDCGLLFIWPVLLRPTMVMRDMLFPLDFIWIRDKQIIQLTENVSPEKTQPWTEYQPDQPVDVVLEVPTGFVQRHNLQVGQSVDWR